MQMYQGRKPRILIVNDDGIKAKGLWHLWKSLKDQVDISIVAPSEEQSGTGMSLTLQTPIRITRVQGFGQTPAWHINATPATCVKMALNTLLDEPPDLIVSGINKGTNVGRNVLYSGTVGGVIEGVINGVQGIAFSNDSFDTERDYSLEIRYIPLVVDYVMQNPLLPGVLLNVNFPCDIDDIKGFKFARQGMECWVDDVVEREHPVDGHPYYWLGIKIGRFEEADNNDSYYLRQGYATAAPIQINDLTDEAEFMKRKHEFEVLLNSGSPVTVGV